MISPNMIITIVIAAVIIPIARLSDILAPAFWLILIAITVARDDAEMLTILFPIRTAESILLRLFIILSTSAAALLPSSARLCILILLTAVSAVSADEKKADKMIRNNKMIILIILSMSKKNALLRH